MCVVGAQLYYDKVRSMKTRRGPQVTNAERAATKIAVTKRDYAPRSVLMAAPIIFTTRVNATSACPYDYSTRWLEQEHAKMRQLRCAPPFNCALDVLADPAHTMACRGAPRVDTEFFGLEPQEFRGGRGFADLLFSITDSSFLFRSEQLRDTASFVDSLTSSVSIILVFFSPQYGITSGTRLSSNASGAPLCVCVCVCVYVVCLRAAEVSPRSVVVCASALSHRRCGLRHAFNTSYVYKHPRQRTTGTLTPCGFAVVSSR
jgi:hypothetical protein